MTNDTAKVIDDAIAANRALPGRASEDRLPGPSLKQDMRRMFQVALIAGAGRAPGCDR